MSIIHDALKKVPNGVQNRASPVVGRPLTSPGAKGGWKIIVLILSAAAVLTAGYVYWSCPSVPKTEPPPPRQGGVNAAPLPPPKPKAESQPTTEPKLEHADTLNIHGIMSDPKGNVVLIDNGIYAEGDEVNGVKIVKITLDGIVVLKDGKEETIRVGQH